MTFYDNYYETVLPDLPSYDFVLDDSPTCHQSLKYWTDRAAEVTANITSVFMICCLGFVLFHKNLLTAIILWQSIIVT